MSAFSKLVKIEFEDATSYPASQSGDVLMIPFEHVWGPVGKPTVLDRNEFMSLYPSDAYVLATTPQLIPSSRLTPYVQILRAFDNGLGTVEAYRVQGDYKYYGVGYSVQGNAITGVFSSAATVEALKQSYKMVVYFKYPGLPAPSLFNCSDPSEIDYVGISVSLNGSAVSIKLEVGSTKQGRTKDDIYSETWSGSINPSATEDGLSIYIKDVIAESQFLDVIMDDSFIQSTVGTTVSTQINDKGDIAAIASTNKVTENHYLSVIQSDLKDPDLCSFTLLAAPLDTTNVVLECAAVVEERKDSNFIAGYPTNLTFTATDIANYRNSAALSNATFFSIMVAAREVYKLNGISMILNGVGAWIGRAVAVAQQNHLNQLPSANAYGQVSTVLKNSLNFNDVLKIHDENGIISIYNTRRGPQIFGVRSLHHKGTSFYGKANVSRVTAAIIKAIYAPVMSVIHTEVVSDPFERLKFSNELNSIIGTFVANKDIKDLSYADVSDNINTDAKTKGGEILNIILVIYFKKLSERVNIKVVATDSSVTISLS